MDTKNLTLEITDAVQRLLGNDYSVSTSDVTKNNGLVLTGLIIKREGENICPTLYINQFLDSYEEDVPVDVDVIAEKIVSFYREHDVPYTSFDVSSISDYTKAKHRIIFQLVNTERNADLLKTIPSVKFLDFSIIFKIYFGDFQMGSASTTITNRMLDLWNVSADTVYKEAQINTPILQEYSLKGMTETLVEQGVINVGMKNILTESKEPDEMYILTNRQLCCGCGCILYPQVLENFAEMIGMDFYILPSSRHEVLLIPERGKDPHYLIKMVREVNRTQVEQEDFLSDNAYYYSRETKEISIV